MSKGIGDFMRVLVRLLYPTRCPFCDGIFLREEKGVCKNCEKKIHRIRDLFCLKCGKKLWEEAEFCEDCKRKTHQFEQGRVLLSYQDIEKASIYRFKYGGRKAYAKQYGLLMRPQMDAFIRKVDPDVIVPIPLHPLRLQKRGYNQAALLAKEVGKQYGIRVDTKLVRRQKNTSPQKRLDLAERQNNLKKAFKITQNDVKLETILLVDDIYTTGSTMDAVAGVLHRAGVKRIFFIALAGGGDWRE